MRSLRAAEITVAAALIATAIVLHVTFYTHAGPLWRDEIVSLHTSQVPFSAFLQRLQFDSYPAFWLLLLRLAAGLFGPALQALRLLGVLTGFLILAAIVVVLRTLGVRVPLLALALAGCLGTVIRYGDSLRAYGFSAVIGLLSMAAIYRTVRQPAAQAYVIALVVSLASVHTTYYNCVLLLACCVAAAGAHLTTRSIRNAVAVMSLGAVCALSMLVYIDVWRNAARWSDMVRYSVDWIWILTKVAEAVGSGGKGWIVCLVMAGALAIGAISNRTELRIEGERRLALVYCSILLAVFIAADFLFLALLQYLMQPWYFLLALVVVAVLIDAIIAIVFESRPELQLLRAAAAIVIVAVAFGAARSEVLYRSTNVDVVARRVAQESAAGDLVIVYPWHLGISFAEYYRGAAPWQTLPPLADHTVHRYDEARTELAGSAAEDALLERGRETLRNGRRLWIAGFPLFYESGAYIGRSTPPGGIAGADFRWSSRLKALIEHEAHSGRIVVPPDPGTIGNERTSLMVFSR